MTNILKNNKIKTLLLVLLLLSITKIDFRFDEINPGSFVDDAEYYYHAQTIAVDKDLDYSNQMPNTPYRNLNKDNKTIELLIDGSFFQEVCVTLWYRSLSPCPFLFMIDFSKYTLKR